MPVLITGFSDACLKRLLEYDYPGNILELRHIVEYAVSLSQAERIELGELLACLTENIAGLNAESPISPSPRGSDALSADEGFDWFALERKMIMEKCRSNSLGHRAGGSCSQPISKVSSQVRGHTF
jgi:transcriptional regulator of acetoin/glycerol metabolism